MMKCNLRLREKCLFTSIIERSSTYFVLCEIDVFGATQNLIKQVGDETHVSKIVESRVILRTRKSAVVCHWLSHWRKPVAPLIRHLRRSMLHHDVPVLGCCLPIRLVPTCVDIARHAVRSDLLHVAHGTSTRRRAVVRHSTRASSSLLVAPLGMHGLEDSLVSRDAGASRVSLDR